MNAKKKMLIIILSITFVIFIFMGVSFAALRSGADSVVSNNTVNIILSPFQKFFTSVGGGIGDFFTYMHDMKTYKEENIALKEEVDELKNQVRELTLHEKENERLRKLLELKSSDKTNRMVACEVTAKDPGNWFYVFTVDKGSNAGISKNDTVITNAGLVGRVSEVGTNWAKVTSIIDTGSSVGAMISRTEEIALVDGDMTLAENGKCRLDFIKSDHSIVAGDTIETSGLGGIYPRGLLIGTVSEIKNDSKGYTRYAIVDTAVDFEKIREVVILKSQN